MDCDTGVEPTDLPASPSRARASWVGLMTELALEFTSPYTVELSPTDVGPPAPGEVRVETAYSAISAGTELLVYRDEVPPELPIDETLDAFEGTFEYPLEYGYSTVGTVADVGSEVSRDWIGEEVFAFRPHRTTFLATPSSLVRLPAGITLEEGALFPTVETATNLVLDCRPRLGDRVVVFGAGLVGLSTVRLLSAFPLEELTVVEPLEGRRKRARALGADRVLQPEAATDAVADADIAVELSGEPETLNAAIEVVGFDGVIVVGSWYGTKRSALELGGRFHRERIDIRSSQVSTLAPAITGRWSRERRLETVLDWLDRIETDRFITHRIPFSEAQRAYELLDADRENTLQVLLTYDRSDW